MTSTAPAVIPRVPALERIVDAHWFQLFISGVIVLNAVVLGIETYVEPGSPTFDTLVLINEAFYLVFLAELILRIASYGRRPWNFFRSGWNIFDFIVIGAALIPAVRAQAEVIRLLRLARDAATGVRPYRGGASDAIAFTTVVREIPSLAAIRALGTPSARQTSFQRHPTAPQIRCHLPVQQTQCSPFTVETVQSSSVVDKVRARRIWCWSARASVAKSETSDQGWPIARGVGCVSALIGSLHRPRRCLQHRSDHGTPARLQPSRPDGRVAKIQTA